MFNPALKFIYPVDNTEYFVKTGKELRTYHKDTNPKYDLLSHLNAETKKQVAERAKHAIKEFVIANPNYKNILIPTHNGLPSFLMSDMDLEQAKKTVGHSEIVHIQYNPTSDNWSKSRICVLSLQKRKITRQ